jgi:hypothetical protein
MEGFTPFQLGVGGSDQSEVVTSDGTPVGAASVMDRTSDGH